MGTNGPTLGNDSPTNELSGFHAIKNIPIPYNDLEPGLLDVCRAINALPFCVTTGMSGGTYVTGDGSEGFCAINYGHLTIALDSADSSYTTFMTGAREICQKYPLIQMRTRKRGEERGHSYPEIDCEPILDFFVEKGVSEDAASIREKIKDAVSSNVSCEDMQAVVQMIHIQSRQIPIQDAQEKIQQFEQFMTELKDFATGLINID